ncbi:hypothetical protein D3C72_1267400 [compost metagenome]
MARTAIFSLLADITRWNTSCCGMEPSIIVMAAAKKNTMSCQLGSGQNLKRSLLTAKATTLSAPPAMSPANIAMTARPMTRMIIWMKSVTATDHMPPNSV